MASQEKSKRKILKAKKTMPASCRKQREILRKLKDVEALETALVGNKVSSDNQNSSIGVINNKCRHSENDASSLNSNKNSVCSQKSKMFSQNLIKPLEIGFETGLQNIEEQVVCPYQKPSKPIASHRKLSTQEAKDSQNISENHLKYQANITRPFFEKHQEDCNLKSISHPHSILNSIVQMPESAVVNTLNDERLDNMVSCLETNSCSASHSKRKSDILSSEIHILPVDQISMAISSPTSSICSTDSLKSEESCRTSDSSISSCANTESTWVSSLDTDRNNSHNQKRMFSENKENVKRMKTSEQINGNICVALEKQTALLEQVKHLIQQEISSVNYKLFDNKLRELTERIGETQHRKHETIADELFAKIEKLQRRIKKILSCQRNCLEPNTLSSDTAFKVANSEILNLDKNPESVTCPAERKTSVNSEPFNLSEKASEKSDLSQDHHEAISERNSDDVILISVESPSLTTPVTSNLSDTRKITSGNSNFHNTDAEVTATEEKKFDSVIDLTMESQSDCNTENPVSMLESSMKSVSISKETTLVAQNETQVLESFVHLPPLPAPPPLQPELVDRLRDIHPPQKPDLKVKCMSKPRSIALSWNVYKINPKCAPVESYHLFLCYEKANYRLFWKKVGEMKALPLPMACTLSQYSICEKYYFAIQSKDIFGRYGPFCDIRCISEFSETHT